MKFHCGIEKPRMKNSHSSHSHDGSAFALFDSTMYCVALFIASAQSELLFKYMSISIWLLRCDYCWPEPLLREL